MKKKSIGIFLIMCLISTLFFGCSVKTFAQKETYKGRVYYEIFVRSFNDSNGDGIGDLKGVTQKLDYLKDLGVTGIWLMPINPSPSYHGYDITDYYNINKDYGTLNDFKELIKEAHKRNIDVIMDFVINHTSSEHPWFQEASKDKNSKYRNYYVWADKNTDVNEVSAINTNPWTKLGDDYYYSIFWSGMPDLNYDNSAVRDEMKKAAKFYLDMGVDGFRLDAAMHIYKEADKNLAWWKEFNNYVKSVNKKAVLVGEVWTNTDVIAQYMKSLDSCFNFPESDGIMKAISDGSAGNVTDQLKSAYDTYKAQNPNYIDSPFLTNHDMDRVMSKLNGDVDGAKKAAAVLLTLPGTPFIYYGEETGMEGQGKDENKREPFIWDNKDTSKNTSWETNDNDPDKIAVNVQEKDKNSLLNFYKQMIELRNKSNILQNGSFDTVETQSDSILAYKRVLDNKQIYVFINLGNDAEKENTNVKGYKVLYSNSRKDKKIGSSLEIKGNEILILQK